MGFENIPGHNPAGAHWQGHDWSSWYEFTELAAARRLDRLLSPADMEKGYATEPALYRFRVRRRKALVYIGQTGKSPQQRLRNHVRGMNIVLGRASPGTRGRLLSGFHHGLAQLHDDELLVEFSWASMRGVSRGDRLGIEAELIAAYRATMHRNPEYQWAEGAEVEAADDPFGEDQF